MSDYAIKAIQTQYAKYEFRSRLEAKWAAFFDECGWPWSYEPVDLNGWIPDFAIGHRPTLVEVKPFFHEHEWRDAQQKILDSGCDRNVILLGADPVLTASQNHSYDAPIIGWIFYPTAFRTTIAERPLFENEPWAWTLNFGFTEGNGELGLCSMSGAWENIIHDPPGGTDHANKWARVNLHDDGELRHRWATACNKSKWMPGR